jgi:hypothetical protein
MKTLRLFQILLLCFGFVHFTFSQQYYQTITFGGLSIENAVNTTSDNSGNIYTAGLYSQSITVGNETITWNGGNVDGFLSVFDSQGNPIDVKGFGGAFDDAAVDVAVDANGNIYITGYFVGSGPSAFDADPGPGVVLLEQFSNIASRDCFIIKLDANRQLVWAKQISNPSGGAANEDSKAIAVDSSGNVYVAGSFIYADFNPDPVDTEEILTQGAANGNDGFLVKLNTNGEFQWVKVFEAAGNASVEDMTLDENEDILLTGRFVNSIDLDPSDTTVAQFTSNGENDVFVVKLDNMGNYVWGNTFGGSGGDSVNVITQTSSGICVGGYLEGSVDLDPGTGVDTITTNGAIDGFFSVFDTTGNYLYGQIIGNTNDNSFLERVYGITESIDGNLIISGTFGGTTDFDASAAVANSTSNGDLDNYILKVMPDGTYIEHHTIGGTDSEGSPQVIQNSAGDYLFIGTFSSLSVDFNPFDGVDTLNNSGSNPDIYVSRFNTSPSMGVNTQNLEQLKLWPNPVSNYIEISGGTRLTAYEIFTMAGQLLKSGEYKNPILVEDLDKGMYFITLKSETFSTTQKFIKR